ncbi:ABC transporter permease [Desulfovibrio sp.]|uniref:ABC transporter permease n=1 Tax=Desulfovibrio sp. TaxID=885 RepID=UPI0035AFB605
MNRCKFLLALAWSSAWNRKGTLSLVVFSIALSTTLLLGMERVRTQVRDSFVQAVSGTDLVVGARGSELQLLLYAVFHMGKASNNIGWDSAQRLAQRRDVAWTIPISLGDSHKGFAVVATTTDFFTLYQYRRHASLQFTQGREFEDIFDVVLGAEVAAREHYRLGDRVLLSHGAGDTRLSLHADKPFTVCGILAPTGTPVDRGLYISLAAMEAIHIDWQGGAPAPGFHARPDQVSKFNLTPKTVTAVLVGLKNRARVFAAQREINTDQQEALMGVMPGVALDQLWSLLRTGENALRVLSWLVTVAGLAGLVATILAGLGERRRELAVLRAAGASPKDIVALLSLESLLLVLAGTFAGTALTAALLAVFGPMLASGYGLSLTLSLPTATEWQLLAAINAAGFFAGLIPAWRAYRISLADGLNASAG